MTELKETIELMESADEKERLVAEYWQTRIRYEKLHRFIIKVLAHRDSIKLNCPFEYLQEQAARMRQYLEILEIRSELENIDLYGFIDFIVKEK